MEFDKKKYISDTINIIIIMATFGIVLTTILLLISKSMPIKEYLYLLLLEAVFIGFYGFTKYYNYLLYNESFTCEYDNNFLIIEYARCVNFFEAIFHKETRVYIKIVVNRIDSMEVKFNNIIISGNMTVEKKIKKIKSKIYSKYRIPNYITNIDLINK